MRAAAHGQCGEQIQRCCYSSSASPFICAQCDVDMAHRWRILGSKRPSAPSSVQPQRVSVEIGMHAAQWLWADLLVCDFAIYPHEPALMATGFVAPHTTAADARPRNGGKVACSPRWCDGRIRRTTWQPQHFRWRWCSNIGSRITHACTAHTRSGAYERTDMLCRCHFRLHPIPFSVVSGRVSTRRVPSFSQSLFSFTTYTTCSAMPRYVPFLCMTSAFNPNYHCFLAVCVSCF